GRKLSLALSCKLIPKCFSPASPSESCCAARAPSGCSSRLARAMFLRLPLRRRPRAVAARNIAVAGNQPGILMRHRGRPLRNADIFSNVRGGVHDPDHRPTQAAKVVLRTAQSDWSKTAETNASGEFEFPAVPAGEYRARVEKEGFAPIEQRVIISGGSAPVLH